MKSTTGIGKISSLLVITLLAVVSTISAFSLSSTHVNISPRATSSTEAFSAANNLYPYFKGINVADGSTANITGKPISIVKRNGHVFVDFFDSNLNRTIGVSPMVIVPKNLAEHPADKILRVANNWGLTISKNLNATLSDPTLRDSLFPQGTIIYFPGKNTHQTISGINADGTAIVYLKTTPPKWIGGTINPTLLFAQPSRVVEYDSILSEAKYNYNASRIYGSNLFNQAWGILDEPITNNLFGRNWRSGQLRKIGIPLSANDNIIGNVSKINGNVYFTTYDTYPNAAFGKIYRITPNGNTTKLFQGPGRFFLAVSKPSDPTKFIASEEGYDSKDPRYQSIFELDTITGKSTVIGFPGDSRGGYPELYGSGGEFDQNGNLLFDRYGFPDEGGGVWWMNLSNYAYKKNLVLWDHNSDFSTTNGYTSNVYPFTTSAPTSATFVLTAKEVENDFKMTLNAGTIQGHDYSTIRINSMSAKNTAVGWNRVIYNPKKPNNPNIIYTQIPHDYDSYINQYPDAVHITYL